MGRTRGEYNFGTFITKFTCTFCDKAFTVSIKSIQMEIFKMYNNSNLEIMEFKKQLQ